MLAQDIKQEWRVVIFKDVLYICRSYSFATDHFRCRNGNSPYPRLPELSSHFAWRLWILMVSFWSFLLCLWVTFSVHAGIILVNYIWLKSMTVFKQVWIFFSPTFSKICISINDLIAGNPNSKILNGVVATVLTKIKLNFGKKVWLNSFNIQLFGFPKTFYPFP